MVINTNAKHQSSTTDGTNPMKVTAPPGTVLVDALADANPVTVTVAGDGTATVQVPPTSAVILMPQ